MNIQPHDRARFGVGLPQRFLKDVRGSLLAEYVVIIGVVGLVVTAALLQMGPSLLQRYLPTRSTLTAPVP